jgi:hypothetical protein
MGTNVFFCLLHTSEINFIVSEQQRCVSDLHTSKECEEKAVKVRVYKVLNYGIDYCIYCINSELDN